MKITASVMFKSFNSGEQYVKTFLPKSISVRDFSDYDSNFAKAKATSLQKVPKYQHQQLGSVEEEKNEKMC